MAVFCVWSEKTVGGGLLGGVQLPQGPMLFSFPYLMEGLQVGEWQGGKHRGGVHPNKNNSFVMCIRREYFYFHIKDYPDENAAAEAAQRLRAELSLSRNLTRNRYRYVTDPSSGDKWLEVQLTQGQTLICDVDALWLVEKYWWGAVCRYDLWYAWSTHGSFHKLLTGYARTDHIDRNGLNNRRVNLREVTHQENMRNRRIGRRHTTPRAGVTYEKGVHFYVAYLGGTKTKKFSINKYGNANAFALACEARANWERENNVLSEVGSCEPPAEPTWERPIFFCPSCDGSFNHKNSLVRHVNRKHAVK